MKKIRNSTVLFDSTIVCELERDGCAGIITRGSFHKRKRRKGTFREQIDENIRYIGGNVEESGEKDEYIRNSPFFPVQNENKEELGIEYLVFGDLFGKGFLLSMLAYIRDIPDDDFKRAVYAYSVDQTLGGLQILQEINARVTVPKSIPEMLVYTQYLFEFVKKLQEMRERDNGKSVGIEESILIRKIHHRLFRILQTAKKGQSTEKQK